MASQAGLLLQLSDPSLARITSHSTPPPRDDDNNNDNDTPNNNKTSRRRPLPQPSSSAFFLETNATQQEAQEWLQKIAQFVLDGKFREALECHDRALEIYELHPSASFRSWCNAGLAWRSKGILHQHLQENRKAVIAWRKAESLFRNCREHIHATLTNPKQDAIHDAIDHAPAQVCLDACIVDVLQARAKLHMKSTSQFRQAIDCHEEVIDLLLDLHRAGDHGGRLPPKLEGITFVTMDAERNTEALVVSLESLGTLYTSTGAYEDGLAAFEEALSILRARQQEAVATRAVNSPSSLKKKPRLRPQQPIILKSMSKILCSLSELYHERNDLERAVDTLHEAIDIRIAIEDIMSEKTGEALEALDRLGQAEEEVGNYDEAVACYEKVLLSRNHYLGDSHPDVAKSLVNVGRILEIQGNTEGSLDLYRAAQSIYAAQVTAKEFVVAAEDVETVLQLIPSLFEQERYEEAVAYLNKCLESEPTEEKKSETMIDRTQIYFTLGEAYIGLGDYVTATVCLVECAKQEGSVPEERITDMLERVEQLRRSEEINLTSTSGSNDPTCTTRTSSRSSIKPYLDDKGIESSSSALDSSGPRVVSQDDEDGAAAGEDGRPTPSDLSGNEGSAEISIGKGGVPKKASPGDRPSSLVTPVTVVEESPTSPSNGDNDEKSPILRYKNQNARSITATKEVLFPEPFELADKSNFDMPSDEEKPVVKASSDVSSSSLSALDLSQLTPDDTQKKQEKLATPTAVAEVPPENEDIEDTDALLITAVTSDSSERRKGRGLRIQSPRKIGKSPSPQPMKSTKPNRSQPAKLGRGFRRPRKGFNTLREEKERRRKRSSSPALRRDEEYHDDNEEEEDEISFDGPIQTIRVESESWDDSISQITFVAAEAERVEHSINRSNEWWWGVTAEGFGRWFPSQFVSQAVEAADGFLSAKAIHSRVKSAPLDVVSDDESAESRILDDDASQIGVATRKTDQCNDILASTKENIAPCDESKKPADLQAMLQASSTERRGREENVEVELKKHLKGLKEQQSELDENDPKLAASFFRLAVLQSRSGDINAAIQSSMTSLRIHQSNGDSSEIAHNLHFLADLYLHEKQYKSSLSVYIEALELEHDVFGEYSEECAKTLNAIGAVRSMQNEFKLAMESHKEALRVLKECHGDELQGNPLVSQTLCQIGAVYYRERNALSTIKSKKDDYSTFVEAGMLEVIGRAHEERGSYKMAIAFFEEKLQFLENDPKSISQEDLATTLNSLGMLSSRAGLYLEALDYYDRALVLQREIGCDEIYVATAQVLKGTIKYQLGGLNESLELLQEALAILKEELGSEHETVAATLYHIGVVKAALCDYDTAMAALKDALQIQNTILGQEHPAALRTRREIGNMFAVYPSEIGTALEHFTEVLAGQQQIHGVRHPNIAETLHAIGCAYSHKGDHSTALKILEECYYMRLEFLGVDHPLQATTLHEIAKIHTKRESWKKASRICDTVLDIRRESLNEDHIDYARALATKASCLVGRGDTNGAMSCAVEAVRVALQVLDEGHPTIANINVILGGIFLRTCHFTEAREATNKALQIFRNANIDDDHPGIQDAVKLLERIEREEMLFV